MACAAMSGDPATWPEVLVWDVCPEVHRSVPSLAHFEMLRSEQFPWLRVVRDIEMPAILDWLTIPSTRDAAVCKPSLKRFLRQMRLNLTAVQSDAGYDRHAISNIIGPMILRGKAARKTLHSEALLQLLEECELYTPASSTVGEGITDDRLENETGEGLHILLVDDQAKHGWKSWVQECLSNAKVKAVTALTKPLKEMLCLFKAQVSDPLTKDLRFRLQLPGLKNGRLPVLLLDLRLFSGNPTGELAFYKDFLLPLVESFAKKEDLAWSAFASHRKDPSKACATLENGTEQMRDIAQEEFQKAYDAVKNGTLKLESPQHHEVLTWLPRVLALADMSLPIVLFSSTGRRQLVGPLKHYGNVITSFEKPRFFDSDVTAARESAISALHHAIGEARQIAQAAAKIRVIQSLPLRQYEAAKAAFTGKKCIEIFHDESANVNRDDFRVAAFAVGFETKSEADAVDADIAKYGPCFFGNGALPKEQVKEDGEKQWKDSIAPLLKDAFETGHIGAAQVLPFVIVSGEGLNHRTVADPFALLDPSGMDNVNQDLLRLLLEVMVSDTLAWIADEDALAATAIERRLECYFYGATRMRFQDSGSNLWQTNKIHEELWQRWRIAASGQIFPEQDRNTRKCSFKWPSLRPDSFHGLLNELVSARGKSEKGTAFCGHIGAAYGTPLPKEEAIKAPHGYRYLHSIADIVARLVDDKDSKDGKVRWDALAENLHFPITLRGAAGLRPQIVRILNCHRALDEGDLVDGFGYGLAVNHEHDVAGNVVALRLGTLVPKLSGEDFCGIVRHVADKGPRWTHSPRLPSKMARP